MTQRSIFEDIGTEIANQQREMRKEEVKEATRNLHSTMQYDSQDVTFFRHKGNEFSNEANKSIKPSKEQLRQRVLNYIRSQGMRGATAEETEQALQLGRSTVSARYTELKALGKIQLIDRRKTSSGRSAGVYYTS